MKKLRSRPEVTTGGRSARPEWAHATIIDPMHYPVTAMAEEQPKPKAKPGPKKGAKQRFCTVEGCDRSHYAKDMCFKHWRASKGYGAGGDRVAANVSYDSSEQGKERHKRSYLKRQIIKKLTGKTSITAAFADPAAVAKLRSSEAALDAVWEFFTEEQKAVLRQREGES